MPLYNELEIVRSSLLELWLQVIGFIPEFLGAIVIFAIGLFVGSVLASLVERLVSILKLDVGLRALGLETYVERAGLKLNAGRFIGQLVFWFFAIFAFFVASNILGLNQVSEFLGTVLLAYIRNIFGAVLIFFGSLILAKFLSNFVRASILSSKLHSGKFLAGLTWWTVVIFGFIGALSQLRIGDYFLNILFMGVVVMLALAGGLAFGLGGREYAAHLIETFRKQVEGK